MPLTLRDEVRITCRREQVRGVYFAMTLEDLTDVEAIADRWPYDDTQVVAIDRERASTSHPALAPRPIVGGCGPCTRELQPCRRPRRATTLGDAVRRDRRGGLRERVKHMTMKLSCVAAFLVGFFSIPLLSDLLRTL